MSLTKPRHIKQLFDLSGKTALVTGGSRGLGLQLAQALGEAGARVMLSSRKAADLEESAAVLKAGGIDVDWIAADCAQEADISVWVTRRSSASVMSIFWSTTPVRPGARRPKTTRSMPGTR